VVVSEKKQFLIDRWLDRVLTFYVTVMLK